MPHILVVDDDPEVRETMASLLRRHKMDYVAVATLKETRQALEQNEFDVMLLDVRLPDGNGLDLLPEIRTLDEPPEVVILTGKGDPDGAELAIQGGVWDYLVKPASIKQISLSLNRALKYHSEKRSKKDLRALDVSKMIGNAQAMRPCFDLLAQAANSDANVLITGETGSGKELFARTIHQNSRRADKPFVVVDCAALTDSLVKSTLFGHKKGAYTGAVTDREGLVQLANKGVLFLDEVGELPMVIQKSFLRVLQERRFRPIGDTREISSDFRLISATNRDLDSMVGRDEFRSDLLYRLKTIHVHLPPLRKRIEDLKPLTLNHVETLCKKYNMAPKGFGADFFDMLMAYAWPGNVRELFNVLELAVTAAGKEKTLYSVHLPQELRIKVTRAQLKFTDPPADTVSAANEHMPALEEKDSMLPSIKEYKNLAEKHYLQQLVDRSEGDVTRMIELSGLSRSHLYALLKKNDISL